MIRLCIQIAIVFMAVSSALGQSPKKQNLVVTRVFEAPVEQVWKAWTDSEYVVRWWGPTGFTCPTAKMDVRAGGKSFVCMRTPKEFGGQDMFNTWSYKKVEPSKRLEFILHFVDKDGNVLDPAKIGIPPGVPKEIRHVLTFKSLGAGKTELTVTEFGYTSDDAVAMSKIGLEQCLDKMAAIFSK